MLAQIIDAINKSISSAGAEARDYYGALLGLATSLANHSISKEEFVRVVTETMVASAEEVYQRAAGAEYALDDDEYTLISNWRMVQEKQLVTLADDIEREGLTSDISNRLQLWASSLGSLGAMGYMQAHRTEEAEWRINTSSKHNCQTCLGLNEHVHQLGWYLDNGYIPGQPGSAGLICGGWECECGLFSTRTGRRLLPLVRMWNT